MPFALSVLSKNIMAMTGKNLVLVSLRWMRRCCSRLAEWMYFHLVRRSLTNVGAPASGVRASAGMSSCLIMGRSR